MAPSQCRPCEPRPTQGDVGDRELPHGSARRPSRAARTRSAPTRRLPIILAATGIARSVRRQPLANGSLSVRPSYCRCRTSTSCSHYRPESPTSPITTRPVIYDILFKASAETMITIAADPKHLGARIGVISVLHTQQRMGGLLQTPIRGARGSTGLSRPLYPSGRHLQPPPGLARRPRRHLQVEGLPPRRSRAIRRDDARYPRVHPPLPDACVAARLPPHPSLRSAQQRRPSPQHRACPRVALSTTHPDRCYQSCQRQGFDKRSARRAKSTRASLPLLRQPHDHHRDLLAPAVLRGPSARGCGGEDLFAHRR